jgi:peptide/nickel transport system permease protein
MQQYILRRLILMIPTLFIVSVFIFTLVRLLPGDIVTLMLEETGDPEQVAQLRAQMGLDQPLPVQYGIWLGDVARGNLGESLWTGNTVASELGRALPVSFQLMIMSIIVAVLIGIPAGLSSAVRQYSLLDYAVRSVSIAGLSIPNFFLATMLLMFPAIWFGWSPSTRFVPFLDDPIANLKLFLPPALVVGYSLSAVTMRMMRSQTLEVLRQDHVRTARAKGLSERNVIGRHTLKNALIPVITVVGASMGTVISGLVITEQIFVLPGLGRLTLWALQVRDYPQIQANILVIVLITMLANLLVDIAYAWLDPRVKYGGGVD